MTLYINNISIKFMHNHILVIHSKFNQKHFQTENTSIEHVTYSHVFSLVWWFKLKNFLKWLSEFIINPWQMYCILQNYTLHLWFDCTCIWCLSLLLLYRYNLAFITSTQVNCWFLFAVRLEMNHIELIKTAQPFKHLYYNLKIKISKSWLFPNGF